MLIAALCGLGLCCAGSKPSLGPAPPGPGPIHVVAPGETLAGIARAYGVSLEDIVRINRIQDPNRIYVGQQLRLPQVARREESPPSPPRPSTGRAPDPPLDCAAHPQRRADHAVSGQGWAWPVDGVILTRFGQLEGERHDGLAIAAPLGTPVYASATGRVLLEGKEPGYGQLVVLEHDNGWLSLYGSLERPCTRASREVEQGRLIGLVGISSGVASPRLYFELRGPRGPVDPKRRLP